MCELNYSSENFINIMVGYNLMIPKFEHTVARVSPLVSLKPEIVIKT